MKGLAGWLYLTYVGGRLIPRISLAVCKEAFNRWIDHNAARLGAALAFYTLLSVAPLLIFVIALMAAFFGRHEAQVWIVRQVSHLVGPQGGAFIKSVLPYVHWHSSGVVAEIAGLIAVLFGASGVCAELRSGLNTLWDAQSGDKAIWKTIAKSRLFAFGMVLVIGFVLLISLLLSTVLAVMVRYFGGLIPAPGPVLFTVNFLGSVYVIAFLFALIFRYVPYARIPWESAWQGALFTAVLFTCGKMLVGYYLGVASIGSAYGAAGSAIAIVVWVYYSAQIFYYGAEFTWVNAMHNRNRPAPPEPPGAAAAKATYI
jgi:membrane protein